MSLTLLAVSFLALLAISYRVYGGWVARQFGIDNSRTTPAHLKKDGVDFVPTRPFYLFGQHFSAIAAAGRSPGPILASQNFGWLPCLFWIGLGVVFIGAVHDFSSLTASVRHQATVRSRRSHASTWANGPDRAMLIFIWIAIVYVIIAFTDITAGSFVSATEELQGVQLNFNPGGAVAAASIIYLALRDHGSGATIPESAIVAFDDHLCAGNAGSLLVRHPYFERIYRGCPTMWGC